MSDLIKSLPVQLVLAVLLCCVGAHAQYARFYPEPLAEVKEFHGPGIGMGCAPSPYYNLFRAEAVKGESAVPMLERLLIEGTPPARVYSALALYSIDKDRGTKALESLEGDTSTVVTLFYCSRGGDTVEGLAAAARKAYLEGAKDFFLASQQGEDERDFLWRQ